MGMDAIRRATCRSNPTARRGVGRPQIHVRRIAGWLARKFSAQIFSSDPRPVHKEVVEIEREIAELEQRLGALRMKRLQVLADHALVNKIPPEILSRVFELGNHEDQHLLQNLSLVSKHWRHVALETPTLWSYVRLDNCWSYGRPVEFRRKIDVYMERSQAALILVDLDFRYCESAEEACALMDCLKPHLHRCFAFRASVPDWEWMTIVKEKTREMGPVLEEFALRIDPGDNEDAVPVPILHGNYPRLHTISLEQTPLACISAEIPNLQHFHLVRDTRYHTNQRIRIALRELLAVLTSTNTIVDVCLQSASFYLDGSESVFWGEPELIVIPQLTELTISFIDATNIGLFFDSVSLPSLFRLAVQMETGPEGDNLGWLVRIASTCSQRMPNLRQLELRSCNVDGAGLAPFIRALHTMPQLSALGLSAPPNGNVGSKLFDLLASGPERVGRWLLPNLEALSVSGCRDVSGHELLRVVRARKEASRDEVCKIRMLRIFPCYTLDDEIVESLKEDVEVLKIVG